MIRLTILRASLPGAVSGGGWPEQVFSPHQVMLRVGYAWAAKTTFGPTRSERDSKKGMVEVRMNHRLNYLMLLPFLFIPLAGVGLADVGPKPHMEFSLVFEGDEVQVESGTLYECDLPDCSDARPLEEVAVQGFRCYENTCTAVAYGFARYHRLALVFSDGVTRRSPVFETQGHISNYVVTVRQSDLLVTPRFNLVDTLRNLIAGLCCPGLALAGAPLALLGGGRRKNG